MDNYQTNGKDQNRAEGICSRYLTWEANKTADKYFVGYEYQEITAKNDVSSVYADGYENFGWKLEGTYPALGKPDSVTMKFKRDRKIRNKSGLARLQHQFDTILSDIISMEASKRLKASIVAYMVGIIGTAFMAGSVFAVTSGLLLPCIILAVPAFIGWLLPYFLYRSIEEKKTASVTPLIDSKYDELYTVCEKASSLLDEAV